MAFCGKAFQPQARAHQPAGSVEQKENGIQLPGSKFPKKKKKKREREIGELGLTRDVKSLNERGSSHHG